METEEKILDDYIVGRSTGDDNRLRASIGSLDAKRSQELTNAMIKLGSTIEHSANNLMINNDSNAQVLNGSMSKQVDNLNQGIALQVSAIIASNERFSLSNEKYAKAMKWLTAALVIVGVVQIVATFFSSLNCK